MKLYYLPGACSLASHIVINELALPATFDKVQRDPRTTEDGSDYFRVNPNGYVPALELDDGAVLTENAAILPYLGDLAPGTGFMPQEGLARYRVMQWLGYVNTEIHGNYKPMFGGPDAAKEPAKAKLLKRYEAVEAALGENDYLAANAPSVADVYLYVVTRWAERLKVDLSAFPKLGAFMQRMSARPAVQKSLGEEGIA